MATISNVSSTGANLYENGTEQKTGPRNVALIEDKSDTEIMQMIEDGMMFEADCVSKLSDLGLHECVLAILDKGLLVDSSEAGFLIVKHGSDDHLHQWIETTSHENLTAKQDGNYSLINLSHRESQVLILLEAGLRPSSDDVELIYEHEWSDAALFCAQKGFHINIDWYSSSFPDEVETRCISKAVELGWNEVVDALISNYVEVNYDTSKRPLLVAIDTDQKELAKKLCDFGARLQYEKGSNVLRSTRDALEKKEWFFDSVF